MHQPGPTCELAARAASVQVCEAGALVQAGGKQAIHLRCMRQAADPVAVRGLAPELAPYQAAAGALCQA